jgi:hypothetical protein
MRSTAAALLALLVTLALPARGHACSCMAQTVEAAIEEAAAIFEGRVAAIEPGEGGLHVRFDVVQTWRAADSEHVEVITAADSAACGYAFEVGRSYLVYARDADGALHTGLCSRTQPIEEADEDRVALGSGTIPVDVEDDPDRPPPRQELAPRGGCAGCAVDGPRGDLGALLALVPLAVLARRRVRR